jgi:hypothetical protein
MLASPTPIESGFADIAEKQPEVLARHFTEAERIEEAAALWGKAGQRLLERSALVEAPAVAIRVKKNPTLSSPPLPPGMSANRAHLALGCLSRLAETSKKAAKYWIDLVALPLFIASLIPEPAVRALAAPLPWSRQRRARLMEARSSKDLACCLRATAAPISRICQARRL